VITVSIRALLLVPAQPFDQMVWIMFFQVRRRFVELSSLIGFWAWYLWLLFLLPDVSTALLYASVAHAICGIIHLQITLR